MPAADLILSGGPVVTVDPQNRIVEAVAVRGDRIVYVGDAAGAEAWRGPKTRVVSLRGRTLLPGLIEAHCHVAGVGAFARSINLKWPEVKSIEQIKALIGAAARRQPPGTWIYGRGYNHLKLAERRHPTRDDLDAVAPDHPVVLVRACGHISAVNSLALRLAEIDERTPDPQGGQIDRDERGRPIGVLRETAAHPIRRVSAQSPEEMRADWKLGSELLMRMGYTSAHEMGHPAPLDRIEAWHRADGLPLRVFSVLSKVGDEHLLPDEGGPAYFLKGDLSFRTGHYKLFADGSSSGPTSGTRQPYAIDPENYGIIIWPQEEVNRSYIRANRLGFPVTAHAVGDRGIEMVLIGQEAAMLDRARMGLAGGGTGLPGIAPAYVASPRHRIEHCAMAMPDLRARIRAGGVIPVAQAVFIWEYGDGYVHDYGHERGSQMMPVKSFLREGIPVALSSDAPVSTAEPMRGLCAAVTRRSQTGEVHGPHERVTLLEAIRCYTLHGAYAEFSEDIKGSIEVGKLADLTVIGAPILDLNPEELPDVPTDMTIIGGRVVHERAG